VAGTSTLTPDERDRRFTDQAWSENPLLRRLVQLYLAGGMTLEQLVADADLDPRDRKRVRFLLENLVEAMAPSNLPLVNPASAKAVIDTAGLSLARGGRQLVTDLVSVARLPEMVDTTGSCSARTARPHPVPWCSATRCSKQVFVISWRNPDARHAAWGLDTYVRAILDALETVEEITGSATTVLGGICAGGILASIVAAYLAGIGQQDRLAALCLAVTVIDNTDAGTVSALTNPRLAALAKAKSARRGYLDGRELAEVFAWLRPGDLVWNYWVNNYLLGKRPPAFDILFWNSDTTRMPARLHADFVDLAVDNSLTRPGASTVLGVPIDLGAITVDAYIAAGIADHITPWESCYITTQLFGGSTRFVLSTSGHIAALVNPPGNPKASYRSNDENPSTAELWLQGAETHQGTWWADLAAWLDERCGDLKPSPRRLGSARLAPLDDAPGSYVFDT
jgi:polyhydroxyalkanoate synthase subunit PhaC